MRQLVFIVVLMTSLAGAQNSRRPPSQEHNGHGWDIRLAVPGEPGSDYPTLGNIPRTHFSCAGKEPGYYADVEAGCQVFRVCTVGSTYGFQSFLCPNGTLFNQDVFVCDWWMNVKCRPAEKLTASNFDKFGNLRLGPQLMKDIKKMLTHTMRNPYDKNAMKSNLIVMQDYKAPAGQLFPNGALIAGPERVPSNVYVPAKQILQPNYNPTYTITDNSYAASTPDTKYVPAGFTNQVQNSDAEVFQKQRAQIAQYVQNNRIQTTPNTEINNFSNGRSQQFIQQNTRQVSSGQPLNHNYNQAQYTQRNNAGTFVTNAYNNNNQRVQLNRQQAQYTEARKPIQFNNGKQNAIVSYAKQQYNENKQPYRYRQPNPTTSNELDVGKELKQNLVSAPVPSTFISKTLTYSKLIQEPKPGKPKSRITVKTWIVKPKAGRLIADPTPYTYDRPQQTPAERLVEESSAYVYTRPTSSSTSSQAARLVTDEGPRPYVYNHPATTPHVERLLSDDDPKPYVYNRPTTPKPAEIIEDDEPKPYVYNRPTTAPKLVATTRTEPLRRAYIPPAPTQPTRRETQAARLDLPQLALPTQASKIILPTTFKPSSRLYLPPESAQIVSRQYLAPPKQASYYQSAQLRAAPSTPTPAYSVPNENNDNISYTVQKQPTITSRKNLTFTDILTKEKLDLTVNDIVRDTGNILQTASPPQFGQYIQENNVNEPDSNYLPAENESGEDLTSQTPSSTTASKSARLIALPARGLEPPVESYIDNKQSNQLSSLPFYKESSVPNTIERTVSLKITLPERVASYIFRGGNETDYNNLEILNTGSSNYLVLSNNMLNQGGNFIPIGRLSENKNSNVSNSQALVFSFLADSLNAAKKYSNIVKQDALTSTSTQTPQIQNFNNEDLSHIANKVSQLTSSQYSNNNNQSPITAARIQTTTSTTQSNQLPGNAKYTNKDQSTAQPLQSAQYNIVPSLQTQLYSSPYQTDSNILKADLLDSNQNAIYSGQLYQLPVPEVTSQIYNRPQSGNLAQTILQHQKQITNLPQATNQNNNLPNHNNLVKQSSAEVEIVQSKTLPITPAKLQLAPNNDPDTISQESLNNLLNSDNGISAQLQDKIVGVIPHPLEEDKLVTYEKDQSYYLFTKFDNNGQSVPTANNAGRQNTQLTRGNSIPNVITFQFVPSVNYQIEDEKEQQKLLNSFQIDEFGAPRDAVKANLVQETNQRATMVSNVDFTVEHPLARQNSLNSVSALYRGPSSYSAPQGSVGNLLRQTLLPNNFSSRLEEVDGKSNDVNGYPKTAPVRRFIF